MDLLTDLQKFESNQGSLCQRFANYSVAVLGPSCWACGRSINYFVSYESVATRALTAESRNRRFARCWARGP